MPALRAASVATSRRPADWHRFQNDSPFGESSQRSDAFGETPKAAGEDARAPQAISMIYG